MDKNWYLSNWALWMLNNEMSILSEQGAISFLWPRMLLVGSMVVAAATSLASHASAGYSSCFENGKSKNGLQIQSQGRFRATLSPVSHMKTVRFTSNASCKYTFLHSTKRLKIMATGGVANDDSSSQSSKLKSGGSIKDRLMRFLEGKADYIWLLGPILSTTAIVVPMVIIPAADLLQKSYWIGLAAILGLDIVFVLSLDVFFVLADKTGHHQKIPGGPSPWIGPWEFTGYPKGLPYLTKYLSYCGVGLAVGALMVSLIVGKLHIALSLFGPYLALIFIQVAYESILESDRVPVYPLVPIVYTLYRFCQLARGMDLVVTLGGGPFLAWVIKLLLVLWTFYLALHLAQIPWLYSTWNSNLRS